MEDKIPLEMKLKLLAEDKLPEQHTSAPGDAVELPS